MFSYFFSSCNSLRKNMEGKKSKKVSEKEHSKVRTAAEIFGNGTLLPTTINYNSNILPEAIFLTTTSGQLITTSSVNNPTQHPITTFINGQQPSTLKTITAMNTTCKDTSDNKNDLKKEEKLEIKSQVAAAVEESPKPSALENATIEISHATQTPIKQEGAYVNVSVTSKNTSTPQPPAQITPQKEALGTFATAFPLLTPAANLTGFTTAQNFAAFSLPNPLLGAGLTIPLYNSLVTVSATKDGVLPPLNKEFFSTPQPTRTKGSKSKNSLISSQNCPNGMTTSKGRKRTAQSRLPAKLKEPAAVARRNARERRRVKMVNDGFLRLRRHVPTDPKNKKLSKVKTLRLAIDYIHHLQDLLQTDSDTKSSNNCVSFTAQIESLDNSYDDMSPEENNEWLQADSLTRVVQGDMDDDIFDTIDPARLRTTYSEYVSR